jgi:hypothetical protein
VQGNLRQNKIGTRIALFLSFVFLFLHVVGEALHFKAHTSPTAIASSYADGDKASILTPSEGVLDTREDSCPLCKITALNAICEPPVIITTLVTLAFVFHWLLPQSNTPSVTIRDTSARAPPVCA